MNSPTTSSRRRPRRAGAKPAPAPALRPGDIDVWRAALDEQPPDAVALMQALLSADEDERARRFYFDRDRRRFIVGRGILRLILGRYLDLPPRDLVFRYGPNGKPALTPAQAGTPPLCFNLTHSDGLALFAFTRVGEVGIDLERIRDLPDWEQVATASFSPREVARIHAAPAGRRPEEFFRAWVRQEAVLKALGIGLSALGAPGADGAMPPGGPVEPAFSVHPLNPAPGYVAALAADRTGRWTTCRTWQAREPLAGFPLPARGRRVRLGPSRRPADTFL